MQRGVKKIYEDAESSAFIEAAKLDLSGVTLIQPLASNPANSSASSKVLQEDSGSPLASILALLFPRAAPSKSELHQPQKNK